MKLGGYNQRIKFVSDGLVPDGYGGVNVAETDILTTWASVEQMKQSRTIEQAQMKFPSTYVVKIQQRSGFEPDTSMLVVWKNKRYQIITAPETNDTLTNQELTFTMTLSK